MKNLIYAARPIALDMLSTLVFVGVSAVTHNPMAATGIALGAGVARVIYLLARGEHVNAMQWLSLGLVVVAGAATLMTHDPRFMMAKASAIYVMVGVAMLERGWMLPYLPPAARGRIGDHVMVGWGYVWAAMMFATAVLNAGFAVFATFAQWTAFIAIFPLASKIALFAVQFTWIRAKAIRHYRAEMASQALAA